MRDLSHGDLLMDDRPEQSDERVARDNGPVWSDAVDQHFQLAIYAREIAAGIEGSSLAQGGNGQAAPLGV